MKTSALLRRGAYELTKPGAWIQGNYAEDAEGNDCDILSPQATCWCAMGILFKLENTEAGGPGALAWRAINELNVALEGQLVHEFNDEASTANEIVALFLATANKLEARGD